MREFPKLKNPPIVEAIVDWNGFVPEGWSLENSKEQITSSLGDTFPHYQAKNVVEANLKVSQNSEFRMDNSNPPSLFSHQYWNGMRNRLVQYRKNGFSFNMLPPYTSFEDEIPLMRQEWERYQSLVMGFQLQEIRLRFINRIVVQIEGESLDWNTYFRIGKDSEEITRGFKNVMKSHQTFWMEELKKQSFGQMIYLEAVQPKLEARIVLDIEMIQSYLNASDSNWERVESILNELRVLKNQVFFEALEEECLKLFL